MDRAPSSRVHCIHLCHWHSIFRPFKVTKLSHFPLGNSFMQFFLILYLHFSLACCQASAVAYSPCFLWHFVLFFSLYCSNPPEQHYYSHSLLPLLILCGSHQLQSGFWFLSCLNPTPDDVFLELRC